MENSACLSDVLPPRTQKLGAFATFHSKPFLLAKQNKQQHQPLTDQPITTFASPHPLFPFPFVGQPSSTPPTIHGKKSGLTLPEKMISKKAPIHPAFFFFSSLLACFDHTTHTYTHTFMHTHAHTPTRIHTHARKTHTEPSRRAFADGKNKACSHAACVLPCWAQRARQQHLRRPCLHSRPSNNMR